MDCILVTYGALPQLDAHDRPLLDELRARGLSVMPGVWNDPSVDWAGARLCVLRSTWDYPYHHRSFLQWIDRTSAVTTLCNEPDILRWNAHKFYLRDLERAGVPIIPTAWLQCGERTRLRELVESRGWNEIIVKPAYGGSSINVMHVRFEDHSLERGQEHLDGLLRDQDGLVQPFLTTLDSYPERALMFIGGAYSHAVTKTPFQTALPSGEAGAAPLVDASDAEIELARQAMLIAPSAPLYARVDLVRDDAGILRVMELELIEPTLFLEEYRPSIAAFADAIEGRIREANLSVKERSTAQ